MEGWRVLATGGQNVSDVFKYLDSDDRVGMMEPTTVTALNSMERRGLVERVRNPHDRRKVNIYLTPKGRSLREVLLPCAAEVSDLATRGIDPSDLALAIDLLHRMIVNLGDTCCVI